MMTPLCQAHYATYGHNKKAPSNFSGCVALEGNYEYTPLSRYVHTH